MKLSGILNAMRRPFLNGAPSAPSVIDSVVGRSSYNRAMIRYQIQDAIREEMERRNLDAAGLAKLLGWREGVVRLMLIDSRASRVELAVIAAALGLGVEIKFVPVPAFDAEDATVQAVTPTA
jgi:hypothetical protein